MGKYFIGALGSNNKQYVPLFSITDTDSERSNRRQSFRKKIFFFIRETKEKNDRKDKVLQRCNLRERTQEKVPRKQNALDFNSFYGYVAFLVEASVFV